ncbi:MAG: hypothetical protein Q9225_007222 [Loekoesia sp. 1 TL-2023]
MLSSIARNCFAAALLFTPTLAEPIAFGNPAFAGITFGHPFTVSWFGGDGTPVSIDLLTGNAPNLQPVTTLTSNFSGSAISWTPIASQSVRTGQLYALSITQSGFTNYSPTFGIGASTASSRQMHGPYGAPVPIGTGRYYPIASRDVPGDSKVHNSDIGFFGTGAIFPRHYATGTPTESWISLAYMTGTEISLAYPTGTSTGSINGLRGAAAKTSSSVAPIENASQKLSLGWFAVVKFLSIGVVLLLLWT